MSVLDLAFERARSRPARVVFPEWDEPTVKTARNTLKKGGICEPVPVSEPSDEQLLALIEMRGAKEALARRMLARPMIRAAAMVAAGEADAMVAGIDTPTRRVIEAASLAIGQADDVRAPSSFFLMRFPDGRELIFSDCAVMVAPDAPHLADIARASARSAEALLGRAEVALLSYSTGTSGTGPSVDLVAEAARLSGFPGPVQADAALNAAIAGRKGIRSGDANVLIFPNLDAGNIAYKLCQQLAGAQALGPFLQGFRKPVCDLSRGATAEDIVAATAITLAMRPD
ncbi:phosphate acetyltransferase [Alphaproteobacteria bacterium GH1-50]|uniref:Phosphate acetyltransferase n=1 Tax=Kangsaoukella pontilimi TaxID=2691042 RepID=A0A7C9IFI9_9RHOB|nr:phosphate acyltransferase [Kangsaoukella pontilimi]MXQ07289.1 phosphate acetyltransferase [Kangsaoukella pontilimi]